MTQKALADYKLREFVFDDSDDETKNNDNKLRNPSISVNDIVDRLEKKEEKKRGRSSPDTDERKTRHKSVGS